MDLKVFITNQDSTCDECGEKLGHHAWITLIENKGALCLSCADLDHLVFLPAGSAALTRRSAKYSTLSAVVLQWGRARKHYERQGLLVEEAALQRAKQECLEDADVRARQSELAAERRVGLDQEYVSCFAEQVRQLFPNCPAGREQIIAEHACQKYSGRVGRSAEAKTLDEKSILSIISDTGTNTIFSAAQFESAGFSFHTVLGLVDEKYRFLRQALRKRQKFFQDMETFLQYILFDSWDDLFSFMCKGLELDTS